jgi:hypothetical protein
MSTTTRRKPRDNGQPGLIALEAASAEILTASVTIKTLRVDSRQLTMGTFRQLPKRKLVHEGTVELLGTVWGHVNYHPDGDHDHRQFVVQFGEELCRCPTWMRRLRFQKIDDWPETLTNAMQLHNSRCAYSFMEAVIRGDAHLPSRTRQVYGKGGGIYSHHEVRIKAYPPFPEVSVWFGKEIDHWNKTDFEESYLGLLQKIEHPEWSPHPDKPATRSQAVGELHELMEQDGYVPGQTGDWWEQELSKGVAWARDYIFRWNALMERLGTVEQLFIAT